MSTHSLPQRLAALAALTITGCLGAHAVAAGTPAAASVRDCPASHWSDAKDLRTSRDRPIYIERPAVVPMQRGRVLLLGFPTFIWKSRDTLDPHGSIALDSLMPAGVMLEPGGGVTVVPYPGGSYTRLWTPRVWVDSSGESWAADVVYGGRASAFDDADVPPTGVWYSRFTGNAWSRPLRLLADTIEWGPASVSNAVREGDTLVLATSTGFTKGWHLLTMRRFGGQWTVRVDPSRGSGYLSLAATPDGVVLARVRALDRPGLNGNSILITRSTPGDSGWSADQPAHFARDGQAHEPQLLSRGDSLWLLWRQLATENGSSEHQVDSLVIAVSSDRGHSWRRQTGIPIGERSAALTALLAPRGGVHAAYLGHVGNREVIGYAYWSGGAWRRAEDLPGPRVVTPPVLAIVGDSLWLLRGRIGGDPEGNSPILTITRRALHCGPAPDLSR